MHHALTEGGRHGARHKLPKTSRLLRNGRSAVISGPGAANFVLSGRRSLRRDLPAGGGPIVR